MNKTLMLSILVPTMLSTLVGCSGGESVSNNRYNPDVVIETVATKIKRDTTETTASLAATEAHTTEAPTVPETTTPVTTEASTTTEETTKAKGVMQDGERMVPINPDGTDISTYPAGTIIVGKEIPERYVDCAIKTIAISSWSGELVTYLDQICILGYDEGYPAVRYATYSPSYEEYSYRVTDELLQDAVVDLSSLNVIYEDADDTITFYISEHDKTYRDKWWPDRERQ